LGWQKLSVTAFVGATLAVLTMLAWEWVTTKQSQWHAETQTKPPSVADQEEIRILADCQDTILEKVPEVNGERIGISFSEGPDDPLRIAPTVLKGQGAMPFPLATVSVFSCELTAFSKKTPF
jgi:hypothetical protein